ncbi:asparagine synthetase B [Ancylomarina sp. 16SWW S1-10-2]|uniref:asparagine synthetase B family protein n=1 Tax=Ancylomarina sp. 16SWW S1-10-2 TaxID=2499681 RepID=UPI0012AD974A|nr:asparagine synthase-related protein [Ancylomarina sp. 16SWW S1-10-2]MRT94657.1 hypothetical protein [Ancylomarina sp. 16SWW S1-10-2]
MCGIVALVGKGDISESLNKIKHRGNDLLKSIKTNHLSIGFNRLAINDKTENGAQPFEFGNLIGAFNAEIYNSDKLRKKHNIKTKSNTDTEVILPLFERFGSSVIQHLDGFYSGLIYNKVTHETYLLRDYIGKKPFFYVKTKKSRFIVSELKAVDSIVEFQIIPKGFSKLKEDKIHLIEQHQTSTVSTDQIKEALIEAVIKRIPKEEKQFGIFLSGGLDSSIVASVISKYAENVIYYTLGNTKDFEYVTLLAKQLGIEAKIRKVALPKPNELPELIKKVVYYTESYNPSIISNGLATFLLSREAHNDGLKVVITGEGADELFCGYTISKNKNKCFEKRIELIENMHYTECRRLDLASMAHTIEIRCPFLDKKVYAISEQCTPNDLIINGQGKKILRTSFKSILPNEISDRKKVSFDVGSGIRKMVVEFLTANGEVEQEALKKIWSKYFHESLSDNYYFHSYPTFDSAIAKRGVVHKSSVQDKIEDLLLREFKDIPFHNIFMLNNIDMIGTALGGTCSDKVLHFKKVLADNGIESKLHSAYINEKECHRMLSIEINDKKYFIDPGSGWGNPKLLPSFEVISYSVFGMTFKTELTNENLLLFHRTNGQFKLMIRIPVKSKSENEIFADIQNRFSNGVGYPFQSSLRFSKVIEDSFYFIKGNRLRIFRSSGIEEHVLRKAEVKNLIQNTFGFDLKNIEKWYPEK